MTDENDVPAVAPDSTAAVPIATAGTRLRDARVAAGLSIDAVAQQLKLAPRQVVALEECDFAALPGRTFVRGFVRNYARLLRLDAVALLEALPDPDAAPGMSEPSLGAFAASDGRTAQPTSTRGRARRAGRFRWRSWRSSPSPPCTN